MVNVTIDFLIYKTFDWTRSTSGAYLFIPSSPGEVRLLFTLIHHVLSVWFTATEHSVIVHASNSFLHMLAFSLVQLPLASLLSSLENSAC